MNTAAAGDVGPDRGNAEALEPVNHKRVARVMCERRIAGLRLRRKVRTTIADPDVTPVPDLIKRDVTALEPNQRYVGDITYLPFDGGNLYLATVIVCYSRRLVGWSIAGTCALSSSPAHCGPPTPSGAPCVARSVTAIMPRFSLSRGFASWPVWAGVPDRFLGLTIC